MGIIMQLLFLVIIKKLVRLAVLTFQPLFNNGMQSYYFKGLALQTSNLNQTQPFTHFFTFYVSQISFLVKGPGWVPGSPRLGNPEDIPDVYS